MNKTKLDERLENAMNAFFETKPEQSHFAMTFTGGTALASGGSTFSEKADKWSTILREVLMFGPGAFFLFCATLTSAFFYGAEGIAFSYQWAATYFLLVFLTYAGSGSIKKVKNLAVPGIVIAMSLAIFFIASFFFSDEKY